MRDGYLSGDLTTSRVRHQAHAAHVEARGMPVSCNAYWVKLRVRNDVGISEAGAC